MGAHSPPPACLQRSFMEGLKGELCYPAQMQSRADLALGRLPKLGRQKEKATGNKDAPGQHSGVQHNRAYSRANPVTLY